MKKVKCVKESCQYEWIARVEKPRKCPLCTAYQIEKKKKPLKTPVAVGG